MVEEGRKEEIFLFNDAVNPLYLRLYGLGHMVQDHSDKKKEETHCHHVGYSFWLAARVLLYAPINRIVHTTAFVTPVMEHWLEQEITQWIWWPIAPWANTLIMELHLAPSIVVSAYHAIHETIHFILERNKQYTIFLIKLSFSSIGQDKSKLQKEISKLQKERNKLPILTEMAAWQQIIS